ncbi:MAG: ROK family protein [Acidobacteriota bacterium]
MRIGIDLGGTKIEAIALRDDGAECFRRRINSPRGNYEATIEAVASLVGETERAVGAASVGVGIPGAVSPATGLIKNANSTWLNGHRLPGDLSRRLQRPVAVANDANCFALSEAVDGAGAGQPVVFGVIVGTGTGGAIVIDGSVVVGANAIGGEWGHNPMPWPEPGEWPGPRCYCGRTGCIETFLSGPGLADDYRAATGRSDGADRIAALAVEGDADAASAVGRYESRMARALAAVINVLDPHVIVLGGGVSNIASLYEHVPRLWKEFVFSDAVVTTLLPARYGDSSGVRGAAWLGGKKPV